MKRILTAALCMLLLALFCLPAAADAPHCVTEPEGFRPVGETAVTWLPEGTTITFDGDLSEWGFCPAVRISSGSLVTFVSDSEGVSLPDTFEITARFAADVNGLYFAFEVADDVVIHAADRMLCNGDALTVGIDLGSMNADYWKKDGQNLLCPPFAMSCCTVCPTEDAEFALTVQNWERTDLLKADGQSVKGAILETQSGFRTEFFLSWARLLADNQTANDPEAYLATVWDENTPLRMGLTLAYTNYRQAPTDTTTPPEWWAVSSSLTPAPGQKQTEHLYAVNSGITLLLDYRPGMELGCRWITCGQSAGTEAPTAEIHVGTTLSEEPPAETPAETSGDETEAPAGGCSAVMAGGTLLLWIAAAYAFLRRKP